MTEGHCAVLVSGVRTIRRITPSANAPHEVYQVWWEWLSSQGQLYVSLACGR